MSSRFANVRVAEIQQDPDNPRKVFPPEELDTLAASIDSQGVLVPVVVHEEGDGYRLIDGDRRWQCANRLGLETIPSIIVDKPDDLSKLVTMFNIHQVREQWQDMPMAWAVGTLIEKTGIEDNNELRDQTGLSVDRLKRLRHALELPHEYQNLIYEGAVPLNFFWELKTNVLEPITRRRADLLQHHSQREILESFVQKRLNNVITDTVSLRKVRPIVYAAADDYDSDGKSDLDPTLHELIENPNTTIDDAYEDTVMVMVEADKLERRSVAIVKGFRRLLDRASTHEERERVTTIAKGLVRSLENLVA